MVERDMLLLRVEHQQAEIERLTAELADWRQAAGVEAGLRREFLTRATAAEAALQEITELGGYQTIDIAQGIAMHALEKSVGV